MVSPTKLIKTRRKAIANEILKVPKVLRVPKVLKVPKVRSPGTWYPEPLTHLTYI